MKAVIYLRVSPRVKRNEQSGSEVAEASIDTQETLCRRAARAEGLDVTKSLIFKDVLAKGSDEDRPGLWEAVRNCRRNTVLVAWRWDRIARGVYLEEFIKRQVERQGSRIHVVESIAQEDTIEGTLVRQIMAVIAEYQRKLNSQRTSAMMREKQRSGIRMSRSTPYGWQDDPANPKLMIPNLEERSILKVAKSMHDGGLAWRKIIEKITAMGLVSRSGEPFHPDVLRRAVRRWEREMQET